MPIDKEILCFLTVNNGDGSGYGDGYGYGYGSGDGDGSGDGYGYGDGSGDGYDYGDFYGDGDGSGGGYGDGSGDGSGDVTAQGVTSINGESVWMLDNTQTIIRSIHGNYAKGAILQGDLSLRPCYIARVGNSFAHGRTLHMAREEALAKEIRNTPVSERVVSFINAFPDPDVSVDGKDLFRWHNILTGSCQMGREAFCRDNGLDPKRDRLTPRQFCELTKNSFGGGVIKMLMAEYGIDTKE